MSVQDLPSSVIAGDSPFCPRCKGLEQTNDCLQFKTDNLDQKTIKKVNFVSKNTIFNLLAMYFFFSVGTFALLLLKKR